MLATSSPCTSAPGQAPPGSCSAHVPGHGMARPVPCHCKVVLFPGPSSSAVSCHPPLGSSPAPCGTQGILPIVCVLGLSLGWSSCLGSSALLPRAAPSPRCPCPFAAQWQLPQCRWHPACSTPAALLVTADPKGSQGLSSARWAKPDKCHGLGHIPLPFPGLGQGWPQ